MENLLTNLNAYCNNLIANVVKIRIKNKYRNVFHLDDPFVNEKIDEYLFPIGCLEGLSIRIKEDYDKFRQEEMLKIYNKLTQLIDKLYKETEKKSNDN